MKKFTTMLLALCLAFSVTACKSTENPKPSGSVEDGPVPSSVPAVVSPDDISDTMTSSDGKYEIAFITDSAQLKDKTFNEGAWNGIKTYAYEHEISYKYYQPANGSEATDEDRYDAMKAAAENGSKIILCAGYLQGNALTRAAQEFPETKFVFIDSADPLVGNDGQVLKNVASVAFHEEQTAYLAGYAVVREGFTKLGFCGGGGGTNPAVNRCAYGFVLGANAAAAEMGIEVDVNYSWAYGSTYSASTELQTMATGWYENGTEIIYVAGGSMFISVTAAASASSGYVVGSDVDQSYESDTVITSAMKGIGQSAQWSIEKFYSGNWDEIGGIGTQLGAVEDAVGLPTATWAMNNYTVEEYETLLNSIKDGSLVIDEDFTKVESLEYSNLRLHII